jgi:lysophospholipase L1-like esterase
MTVRALLSCVLLLSLSPGAWPKEPAVAPAAVAPAPVAPAAPEVRPPGAANHFEDEIRNFEAADRKKMPPRDAILFVGSSSIRRWKTLAQDFPGTAVINRGFGGSTIPESTLHAPRIIFPYHPRRIVFYAGENDLASGASPAQVLADFKAFVTTVRARLPRVPIDFISIKPSPLRWRLADQFKAANTLVRDYVKQTPQIRYIDVWPLLLGEDGAPRPELFDRDRLHLNAAGYRLWRDIIGPRLEAPPRQ